MPRFGVGQEDDNPLFDVPFVGGLRSVQMECPVGFTPLYYWDAQGRGADLRWSVCTHVACKDAVDPTQHTFGGQAVVRTTLALAERWVCAHCGQPLCDEEPPDRA